MAERLPRVFGRAPRIALLVYNQVSTDNRVLKTAATLRDAGADVLIVGSARPGYPAGAALGGDGLAIHRASDFDLVRLLPWLATFVRRVRGDARAPTPEGSKETNAAPPSSNRPTAKGASIVSVAGDLWMRLYQVVRLVWFWAGAVRHLRGWRPDVVHANDGNTLAPAMLLKTVAGSRFVYDAHELWTRRNVRSDRMLAPLVEAVTERLGVRASAGVITVSPSIVAWMKRRFRLRTAPTLVRNIPHRRGPVPERQQGRLRELAGLPASARVVGYCGGVTTGRGLEETLQALAELDAGTHLVMLGYGDPAYVTRLLDQARALGLGERVHLVGPVPGPEVPEALADADVSVVYVRPICLSYRYSLPNKLFESIHGGLPVVAADLPDTAAIVQEYDVGEVFGADRPDQLAAAIERVSADADRYRAAARAAADELDWSHEAAELVALYTRVLDR
ncbi:glycosyltransferase [Pseudactinotalea sp.]|uniref:glycosyltransferase n=1 Tax=Pseudactinotalea sp. TaxID=1926260 RepID=UPI003B3B036A